MDSLHPLHAARRILRAEPRSGPGLCPTQELEQMLKDMISEERRVEADLEKTERQQMERAKLFLQEQMLDSDFSWIKQTKKSSAVGHSEPRAIAATR
jgi:hypothetical protein